jgi:hypothetical protein
VATVGVVDGTDAVYVEAAMERVRSGYGERSVNGTRNVGGRCVRMTARLLTCVVACVLPAAVLGCTQSTVCEVGQRRCRGDVVDLCMPEGWVIDRRCVPPSYCRAAPRPLWAECAVGREGI